MLAHKATHEAKVAAEVIAGEDAVFDARGDPVGRLHRPRGRVGRADRDAGQGGRHRVRGGEVPVGGVGPRARAGRATGLTKLLVDPESQRVLGAGIVGAERRRAHRRGRRWRSRWAPTPSDLGLTIHAHPTLIGDGRLRRGDRRGTITDLPPKRKRGT